MPICTDQVRCIVFDFAGTLCSEAYFAPLGSGFQALVTELVFGDRSKGWADPWMRGEISSRDVVTYLARNSRHGRSEILAALREGCRNLTFNAAVWELARAQKAEGRKTALVTANMDVFSEVVAPANALADVFDVILNTADYGTLDKEILWRRAFQQLGGGHNFHTSLLIEDSPATIDLFSKLGGIAYRYTRDAELERWLAANPGLQTQTSDDIIG